ncbi:type IV secretion system protein VirB10 [Xenorhabdus sp. KK7.4]|uniref:type IV secretion system protein VirB10 n=1 Tax=Xenorhabdus sp. KK7.4 TaxID=1851572 RepID=UPI000C04182D|nr:type IV secretion system protein VirB10 [Xenorhabdus sp. KK7.4]PHM51290.1 type IV secretion system channel protein VirB10 [Xenorhabdus sp. KK7.4]
MAKNREDLEHDEENSADRGMPSISKNRKKGASGSIGQKIILGVVATLVLLALIAVNGGFKGDEEEERSTASTNDSGVVNLLGPAPSLPPPPPPPAKEEIQQQEVILDTGLIAPPPPPNPISHTNYENGSREQTPEERKRTKTLLAFGNVRTTNGQSGSSSSNEEISALEKRLEQLRNQGDSGGSSSLLSNSDRADSLSNKLKSTTIDGSRASLLLDRSYFITQGSFLNCSLETALSSDVPGMTACRLTDDVYSTDKKVLLLEKGSKIVGQYQGGMQKGQARIFVLWTRIETPKGVLVKLDSPGTDALGRSGLDGFVDTHFWERFGSAIMLSTIGDIGSYVVNKANKGSRTQLNFGNTAESTKDMAGIALENSINIPPTLLKNQGDSISIFVARDLDFRGVYDLKATY